MRSLPSVLLIEKNQLSSLNPFVYLFEVKIRTGQSPDTFTSIYLVNYDENIVFNSNTYVSFPIKLTSLSENSSGEITRMQVAIANVDQTIIALLEQYWKSVTDPLWEVSIWLVDATQPAQTPTTSKDIFEVISVTTDLFVSSFELRANGISLSRLIPGLNFTRNTGFPNIPRKIR